MKIDGRGLEQDFSRGRFVCVSSHLPAARLSFLLVALLASLGGACGGAEPDDAARTETEPPLGTLTATTGVPDSSSSTTATATPILAIGASGFGVAGVIPSNFPDSEQADWTAFYDSLTETGTMLGVYTNWYDTPLLASRPPEVFAAVRRPAAARDITVVAALGTHRTGSSGVLEPTVEFGDPRSEAAFLTAVHALVIAEHPRYLAIGGEINLLADQDPDAFEAFVVLYRRAYTIVKAASPETAVFTVFQYEHLRGGAFLMDGVTDRPARWDLLARFEGALDLLGLTTYAFFDYETPSDVPADYYRDAAERVEVPLAFTEVGWPAAALRNALDSGFGGTPEEQAEFVARFGNLIGELNVEFALWAFPHDPPGAPVPFEAVALRENDGTVRPALDAWRALAGRD